MSILVRCPDFRCTPYCSVSHLRCNHLLAGVLSTAAGVAKDQAEADEDMSIKQRLVLAGGSTLTGASEMVDNEIIAGAMEVAGKNENVHV